MRVLMVSGEYPPMSGGIAGYTHILNDALASIDVDAQTFSDARSSADYTVSHWTWRSARDVQRAARKSGADLVHIQYQAGAFAMHPIINLMPLLLKDIPVVTTFHDLRVPYLFPRAGRVRHLSIKRMARHSDAVIVTNHVDGRTLAASGIDADWIPLGSSLPPPEGTPAVANSVGYFGYPSAQKGFDVLVQAIVLLEASDRPRLSVVGSPPSDVGTHGFYSRREADAIAQRHGVSICWTGYLDGQQASNALAGCGVIAFPFPNGATLRSSALLAALQSGRPVLTTEPATRGDLAELAEVTTLFRVPDPDPHELAQLISEHLPDPTASVHLPDAFQWPSIAGKHRDLYQRVIARTHP